MSETVAFLAAIYSSSHGVMRWKLRPIEVSDKSPIDLIVSGIHLLMERDLHKCYLVYCVNTEITTDTRTTYTLPMVPGWDTALKEG